MKYKLLKDLPYTKAGVIYTPENHNPDYYNYNGGEYRNRIGKNYVENNPEWFAPVEETIPCTRTDLIYLISLTRDQRLADTVKVLNEFLHLRKKNK